MVELPSGYGTTFVNARSTDLNWILGILLPGRFAPSSTLASKGNGKFSTVPEKELAVIVKSETVNAKG